MKMAVFSTKAYDRKFFEEVNNEYGHKLEFFDVRLNEQTCELAKGSKAVCVFVNDHLNKEVLSCLSKKGVELIALRCAGFNNIDLKTADEFRMTVVRVSAYSPHAVAEHTIALILALNRKIYRAYSRIREGNFSLEGLLGFDLNGKTVGVLGTGKIGSLVVRIMHGFGAKILLYDQFKNSECEQLGKYTDLKEIFHNSDIISLHLPLIPETHHIINRVSLSQLKEGVMIINTSRGGLLDTKMVIAALKSGKIGYLGLDVYEEEGDLFFEDLSGKVIQDDVFARLLTFPNVIITGHQAFFTQTALRNIAETTLQNVSNFEKGMEPLDNIVNQTLILSMEKQLVELK